MNRLKPAWRRLALPVPSAARGARQRSSIRAKLKTQDLALSPEAERRTLHRRLRYDLPGWPPTPEEVVEAVLA